MPENGKLFYADALLFEVSSVASTPGSVASDEHWTHEAGLTKYAQLNINALYEAFSLYVEGSDSGSQRTVTIAGYSPVSASGGSATSVSAAIRVKDYTIYGRPSYGTFYETWSGVEVYIDGLLYSTLAAGSSESAGFAPNYPMFTGLVPRMYGNCTAGSAAGLGRPPTYDSEVSITSVVSGGWTLREASTDAWAAFPVRIFDDWSSPTSSDPYAPPYNLDSSGIIVSSQTYGEQLNCTGYSHDTRAGTGTCGVNAVAGLGTRLVETRNGVVWLLPELDQEVVRMNPDYAALIYRFGLPETIIKRERYWAIGDPNVLVPYPSVATETTVQSATTKGPFIATQFAGSPETEVFNAKRYAPCMVGHTKTYADNPSADPCDDWATTTQNLKSESVGVTFPSKCDFDGNQASYLTIIGDTLSFAAARYATTWGHPLWSYFMYPVPWELNGGGVPWEDYWGLIRQQWLDVAGVASPRRTRNHIITEPCVDDNRWFAWQAAFTAGAPWWGISRFHVKRVTPLSSYTYSSASSSLWSSPDSTCTLTHGSDITVTSTGGTTLKVRLDLGSFTVEPYQYPHICEAIKSDWTTTNVVSVSAYAIGLDGSQVLIGTDTNIKNTTVHIPRGDAVGYAGDWALDNGVSGIITDVGSDVEPGGNSPAVCADPERIAAVGYLEGSSRIAIDFVITITNPATAIHLKYPTLSIYDRRRANFVWETGSSGAYIAEYATDPTTGLKVDGIGIRFGNQDYYDPDLGWLIPPSIYGRSWKPSIIDTLAWERHWLEGISETSGLTTEIATYFDSYESNSVGAVENGTSGFVLPLLPGSLAKTPFVRFGLVSSASECPPLSMLPRKERNKSTWLESGSYCLKVYSMIQESCRYIVQGKRPMHLYDPDGNRWTNIDTGWPSGWMVTYHRHEVDNSESNDFELRVE